MITDDPNHPSDMRHWSKSSSRRLPSSPTTSPWNSSPGSQSKSKHKTGSLTTDDGSVGALICLGRTVICYSKFFIKSMIISLTLIGLSYLNIPTEFCDFIFSWLHIRFIFNRCQSQMPYAFNFQMSIKMFYTTDYSLTFRYIRSGPQCNGISFLPTLNSCMWFVCVTPRSASIYKCLKLSGNISPIRWRN